MKTRIACQRKTATGAGALSPIATAAGALSILATAAGSETR